MTDTRKFTLTESEQTSLAQLFELAEGHGGGAARARRLLCAWFNASELGGFDFADLWGFDDKHLRAAAVVLQLIARSPQGTYPSDLPGFGARMRDLAGRQRPSPTEET